MKKLILLLLLVPLFNSCSKSEDSSKFTEKLNNSVWSIQYNISSISYIRFSSNYVIELFIHNYNYNQDTGSSDPTKGGLPGGGVHMKLSEGLAQDQEKEWLTEITVDDEFNYAYTQKTVGGTSTINREFKFYYNENSDVIELIEVCNGTGERIFKRSSTDIVDSWSYSQPNETNWATCL